MGKIRKISISFAAVASMAFGGCTYNNQGNALDAHDLTPSAECSQSILNQFNTDQATQNGDGHDVIVVPGFSSNNFFMASLRSALTERGYTTHTWAGDYNSGPSASDAAAFEQQVLDLYEQNGNQKISLVGYSLGGVYARELARAHPDKIRNVVTLSSPIELKEADGRVNIVLQQISDFYNDGAMPTDGLEVPTSSFVSETDFIVKWQDAINNDTTKAENIVINIGHMSMPRSTQAYNIIAERLSYTGDDWKPLADLYCQPKAQSQITR